MKKIKWPLLLIAVLATCAGYVNKPKASPKDMHTYAYWQTVSGRYYYYYDLTSYNMVQGLDYDCVYPGYMCTFIANPLSSHTDVTGSYFYITDVPASGIEWDETFELF
jgi:hypothetical protein